MVERKRIEGNERLILGIDPGFGRMGYAVVAAAGNELRLLICDATVTPTGQAYPLRLQLIYEELVRRFGAYEIPSQGRRG